MAKDYAYLVKVNPNANQNRFCEIIENDDNSIDVNWGRVGTKGLPKHYKPNTVSFSQLVDEKIKADYQLVSSLHSEKNEKSTLQEALSYKPIEDEQVQEVMNLLINSSREFLQKNYSVKPMDITDKMICEAEADINTLISIAENGGWSNNLYEFNKTLQTLFTDVPRKMDNVKDNLAQTEQDMASVIEKEIDMLDNLKRIREQEKDEQAFDNNKNKTFLEAYGLKMRPVTYKEEDQITTHLGADYEGQVERRYIRAFAVENTNTRANYEHYKKQNNITPNNVRLFYHGSKVENWQSIISQGMLLNPDAKVTGKMFGQGLYFASECRKALNYMDTKGSHWNNGNRETGYTAVFAVALGKCYEPSKVLGSDFTEKNLPQGCNSVYASKRNPYLNLKNDEYIVYNQNACTIKYLLEMSNKYVHDLEFNLNRNILRNNLEVGFDNLTKTSTGLRAELSIEHLDTSAMQEINSRIIKSSDCDHLYLDYNANQDTIAFTAVNSSGDNVPLSPYLTKNDYAFVAREMKKAFAESENEWKSLVKASNAYSIGNVVATKNGLIDKDENITKTITQIKE